MATKCDCLVCKDCGSLILKEDSGLWHGAHSKEDFDSAKEQGFFLDAPVWEEIEKTVCCKD